MAKETIKGAPPCGLYIKIAPEHMGDFDKLGGDLNRICLALKNSAYEKNMHVFEIAPPLEKGDKSYRTKAQKIVTIAQKGGVVPIFRGNPETAFEYGAEGVLLENWDDFEKARDVFGDEGIAGLCCENDPEKAAAAFDKKADFISIGMKKGGMPALDALKFWVMLTDFPAVIEGPITNDYADYYVNAGAGFLDASDYIWNHPEGVMKACVNMLYAIELADQNKDQKTAQ